VGGRVVREYVGRGRIGELAEREDRARRDARIADRVARQRQREEDRRVRDLVVEVERRAATLTALTLIAAGYHRPKRGMWRRKRGHSIS
jgi:uncharacterized protein YjaZ